MHSSARPSGTKNGGQHLDRPLERRQREDLAADVGVHADQLDRGSGPAQPGDRLGGRARGQAEAELGVVLAGPHVLVGVGLDAGRDPDQDGRARPGGDLGDQSLEPVDLVEGVDDDAADPGRERRGAARRRTCCCRAGRAARPGTPAARATWSSPPVETSMAHALLVGQAGHGPAEERLRGVGDPVAEGGDRLPAAARGGAPRRRRTPGCRPRGTARRGRRRRCAGRRRRRSALSGSRPERERARPVGSAVALGRVTSTPGVTSPSHRLRSVDAEQAEADGEADAGRLDQPQAGLGELVGDVGMDDVAVVVEAVEAVGQLADPRGDLVGGPLGAGASATTSGSSDRQRSTSSSRSWASRDRSTSARGRRVTSRRAASRPMPAMRA